MIHRFHQIAIALLLLCIVSPAYAQSNKGKAPVEAYHAILEKAEAGDAEAQAAIGCIYMYALDKFEGITIEQDGEKAVYWLTQSAESGNSDAMLQLQNIYLTDDYGVKTDFELGLKWGLKAAQNGVALAQHRVAIQYLKGEGVPQDPQKAIMYLEKAANQGSPSAIKDLGEFYYNGVGVQQSFEKAHKLYVAAAKKGILIALQRLTEMHFNGLGVPVDKIEAYKWSALAALKGDQFSMKGQLAAQLSSSEIQKGEDLADKWLWTFDRYKEAFPR